MLHILFLFLHSGLSMAQSISWLRTCESGLLHQKQNIIINSHVYQTGPNGTMDRAQFEIKTRDSQTSTCYLDLTQCRVYKYSYCYCLPTHVQHVLHAVVNLTATTSVSQATVRGVVYNLDFRAASEELTLPTVYDPATIEMLVHINTVQMNVKNCHTSINEPLVIIVLQIPDNIKLQYETTLQESETNKTLNTGSNLLIYSRHVSDRFSFKVSYHVIQDVSSKWSFQCTARVESKNTYKTEQIALLLAVPIATVMGCSIIFCILYKRWKIARHIAKRKSSYRRDKRSKNTRTTKLELEERLGCDSNEENFIVLVQEDSIKLISDDLPTSIPDNIMSLIKDIENQKDNDTRKIKNKSQTSASRKFLGNANENFAYLSNLVHSQLEIMVKVEASTVSDRRPKSWPGAVSPYPFHRTAGGQQKRAGIGRIVHARKFDTFSRTKSRVWRTVDPPCRTSEPSMSQWVEIEVYVSRHIIFDDSEAKHSICTLLMKTEGNSVTRFKGKLVRMANIEENWTIITCVSKDVEIFDSLNENILRFDKEWEKMNKSYTHFSAINNIGFIVILSVLETKGSKFDGLLDQFKKDIYHKSLFFALNTIFEVQKMAIYMERTSESVVCGLQKEKCLNLFFVLDLNKFILGSLPLIVKMI